MHLRLFYGLSILVILFWLAGITALWMMRASTRQFDNRFEGGMRASESTRRIGSLVATLNNHVLPQLAGASSAEPPDRQIFDAIHKELAGELQTLRNSGLGCERWHAAMSLMDEAVPAYLGGLERYFRDNPGSPEERQELHRFANSHAQRVADLSNGTLSLAEAELRDGAAEFHGESGRTMLLAGVFILLGTVTGILVYFQFARHLVDPVEGLQRSIEEIRKGNYELALPQPDRKTPFARVVSAFNEMAAELSESRGRIDESLRRANIVNRAILNAIPSPVFVLSDEGDFLQVNPAAESLSQSLGTSGRLPTKIQHIFEQCRKNRSHYLPEDPRDALVFRVQEEEFFYLPRIFRFDSEDHTLSGWAVLLHNVSRIRWLDEMKTSLLTTVSHEIKTPLTGIRMVLLLLLEERSGSLDEMQRTLVGSASADCERLLVTLNKLLELSRAESGSIHLNRIPLSLPASVEAMRPQFEAAGSGRRLKFRIERTGDDIPKVLADPVRLSEVFSNLVSNAIDHSPDGGEIVLQISKPDAEHIRLSVFDQGPGVPEGSQSRIFERFYRVPCQGSQGLGLGLFISRDIMIAHEGRIGLLERSEDRTEFFIDVPIA